MRTRAEQQAEKAEWDTKIGGMSDAELLDACKQYIWLSAYAGNNPRSKYHWMVDACYDEAAKRHKVTEIYSEAHKQVSESV